MQGKCKSKCGRKEKKLKGACEGDGCVCCYKKCKKKDKNCDGFCVKTKKECKGGIFTEGACSRGCSCCTPQCKPKRKCKDGYCVLKKKDCTGTILPNGCKKKPKGRCFCCVPTTSTTTTTTATTSTTVKTTTTTVKGTTTTPSGTTTTPSGTTTTPAGTTTTPAGTTTTPAGNTTTPAGNTTTPAGNTTTPAGNTTTPAGNTTTPAGNTTTPAGNTTTPAGNTTTPAGNTTTPAGNTTTPAGNTTTPAGNTTTPAGNTTTPAGNTTTPAGNTTTPAGNTTTPAGNTTTPAGNTTTPAGNTTTPAGNTTTPAGNTTTPAGNTTTPAGNTTTPAGNTTTPAGNTTTPAGNTTSNSILPALNARVASLLDLQRSIVNVSKEMQTSLDIVNNISTTVNTRRHRRNVGILTALTSLLVQVEEATNRNDSANLTALAQAIKIQRSDLETLAANVRTNSSLATEIKGSVATTIQKFQTTTALLREKDNQIKSEVDILQQQISQQGGSTVLVSTANIPLVTTAMTTSTISSTNITANSTTTPAGNTTTPAGNTTTPAGNTTTPAGNTTSNSILPALNARVASLLDLQRSIVNVSKEMQTSLDIVNNISTTVNTRRHRRNVGILTALTSLLVQVEEATNRNDSANLTALAQAIKIQRSDLETLAANVRTNSSLATEIKGSVATTIQKFQTTTALLGEKDNQIKSEVDILQQQISQQGGSTVLVSTANIQVVTA
ncbi:mucin-2-like, partial [Penaeus indicus]|uniref:mucin-2-like n=1 Tax=Penaeus indicus TaxID=29960 RepID=UPI00300C5A87